MRMNQDERRFDFHGLGAALKRAREEKGWTQAYVAELVDRDSRTIMNIENKEDMDEVKELMNEVWRTQKSMLSKQPLIKR